MVQIIAGGKGKGKTKYLLDMANKAVKESKGTVVYLDKSSKHMYELNNRIRLINVQEYPIENGEGFVGFLCGIICQDHDLEQMYLDSFIKLSSLEGEDIEHVLTASARSIMWISSSAFPEMRMRFRKHSRRTLLFLSNFR